MIPVVATLIVLTVAVAGLVIGPRTLEREVIADTALDLPHAFGRSMTWLALRTRETSRVAQALGLASSRQANWATGIGAVYDSVRSSRQVFVSPPVSGWTFVIGLPLPHPLGGAFVDKALPLILKLSAAFPDVQYFASHPGISHFAWARGQSGNLLRAMAVSDGVVLWNIGPPSEEERRLGIRAYEARGLTRRDGDVGESIVLVPTEDHVMAIARQWSIDPTRLPTFHTERALGQLAHAPAAWRTQLVMRSA